MKLRITAITLAGLMAIGWADALAQQPTVSNARLETRSAAVGLTATMQSLIAAHDSPAWIGYAVAMVPGDRHMCCGGSSCCEPCRLETTRVTSVSGTPSQPTTVQLEGPSHLVVLTRIEYKTVATIRNYSIDCRLDAGGLPFYWLTDVSPRHSLEWLSTFAVRTGDKGDSAKLGRKALSSIAMHRDPSADAVLKGFVAPTQPEGLRREAVFWLGQARGRAGYQVVRDVLRTDLSDGVREKAVFALSQSREAEAIGDVVQAAKTDKSTRVRGQALFWLAQKASREAAQAITEAIERDPETEVKKKAVFALTQLPSEQGVPMLIQVARSNQNPVVRKQAMFWLGQSKDPRALAFFEEILTRR